MDQVIGPRQIKSLPWEAQHVQDVPWHLHQWFANVNTGLFQLVDNVIVHEMNEESGRKEWMRGERLITLPTQTPDLIERDELEAIFIRSATLKEPLLESFIQIRGEEDFSPAWLEKAREATAYFAHEKYADVPAQPKKRGPGRPRKTEE